LRMKTSMLFFFSGCRWNLFTSYISHITLRVFWFFFLPCAEIPSRPPRVIFICPPPIVISIDHALWGSFFVFFSGLTLFPTNWGPPSLFLLYTIRILSMLLPPHSLHVPLPPLSFHLFPLESHLATLLPPPEKIEVLILMLPR